jgi:hypothetical protein
MKRVKRTRIELKKVGNQIVKYYFNNPENNGYRAIIDRFRVNESFIRKVLTIEMEKRFNKKQCIKG